MRDLEGAQQALGEQLVRREAGELRPATEEADRVLYAALSRGLNFKVTMGNILTLTPALTVSESQLDRAIDILDECLTVVGRETAGKTPVTSTV